MTEPNPERTDNVDADVATNTQNNQEPLLPIQNDELINQNAVADVLNTQNVVQDIVADTQNVAQKPVTEVPSTVVEPVADVPSTVVEPVADVPSTVNDPVADVQSVAVEPVKDVPNIVSDTQSAAQEPVAVVPNVVAEPVADVQSATQEPVADVPSVVVEPVTDIQSTVNEPVTVQEPTIELAQDVPSVVKEPVQDVPNVGPEPVADVQSAVVEPVQDVPNVVPEPVADVQSVVKEPVQDVPNVVPEPVADVQSAVVEPVQYVQTVAQEPVVDVSNTANESVIVQEPVADTQSTSVEPIPNVQNVVPEPVANIQSAVQEPVADVQSAVQEPVADVPNVVSEPVADVQSVVVEPVQDVPNVVEPVVEVQSTVQEPIPDVQSTVQEPIPDVQSTVQEPIPDVPNVVEPTLDVQNVAELNTPLLKSDVTADSIYDVLNNAKVTIMCGTEAWQQLNNDVVCGSEPTVFTVQFHDSLQFSLFADNAIVYVDRADNCLRLSTDNLLDQNFVFCLCLGEDRIGSKNHPYGVFDTDTITMKCTTMSGYISKNGGQLQLGDVGDRIDMNIVADNDYQGAKKKLFKDTKTIVEIANHNKLSNFTQPLLLSDIDSMDVVNNLNCTVGALYKSADGLWWKTSDQLINLLDRKDGVNGVNGVNGVDGLNGRDGIDGKDGLNGRDGKDGLNGCNGLNGKDADLSAPILITPPAGNVPAYSFSGAADAGLFWNNGLGLAYNADIYALLDQQGLRVPISLSLYSRHNYGSLYQKNGEPDLYWKSGDQEFNLTKPLNFNPKIDANSYCFPHDSLTGMNSYDLGKLTLTANATDVINITDEKVDISCNTNVAGSVAATNVTAKSLSLNNTVINVVNNAVCVNQVPVLLENPVTYPLVGNCAVGDLVGSVVIDNTVVVEKVSGAKWSIEGQCDNIRAICLGKSGNFMIKQNVLVYYDENCGEEPKLQLDDALSYKIVEVGTKQCCVVAKKDENTLTITKITLTNDKLVVEKQLTQDYKQNFTSYDVIYDDDGINNVLAVSMFVPKNNNVSLQLFAVQPDLLVGCSSNNISTELITDTDKSLHMLCMPGHNLIISYYHYKMLVNLSCAYNETPIINNTIINIDSIDCINMTYDVTNEVIVSLEKTIISTAFLQILDVYGNQLNILRSKNINDSTLSPLNVTYDKANDCYIVYAHDVNNGLVAYVVTNKDYIMVRNNYWQEHAMQASDLPNNILVSNNRVFLNGVLYKFTNNVGILPQNYLGLAKSINNGIVEVALKGSVWTLDVQLPAKLVGKKVYLDRVDKPFPKNLTTNETSILVGTVMDFNKLLVGL